MHFAVLISALLGAALAQPGRLVTDSSTPVPDMSSHPKNGPLYHEQDTPERCRLRPESIHQRRTSVATGFATDSCSHFSKRDQRSVIVFISKLEFNEDQEGRISGMTFDLQLGKQKKTCRQVQAQVAGRSTQIDCGTRNWSVKFHNMSGNRFLDIYYEDKSAHVEADGSMALPPHTREGTLHGFQKYKQSAPFQTYIHIIS